MISAGTGHMTLAGAERRSRGIFLAERWDPERVVRLSVKTRPEEAAGTRESQMTQYLISSAPTRWTTPRRGRAAVAKAAHAAVQEAITPACTCPPAGWKTSRRASWPPTGRSPTARTRRPSAGSRSSTCPHARRRWSGPPRSPSPAAARKRSGDRGDPELDAMLRQAKAGGDVPAAPPTRPGAPGQDSPWGRPDNAGLRACPEPGRGAAPRGPDAADRSAGPTGPPLSLTALSASDGQGARRGRARAPDCRSKALAGLLGRWSERTQTIELGVLASEGVWGDQAACA